MEVTPVEVLVEQFVGMLLPFPRAVRGSVVNAQVERTGVVLLRLQKAQGAGRDVVRDVAGLTGYLAVPDYRRIVIGSTAQGVRLPKRKALLRVVRITQVPLPAQTTDPAPLGQHIRIAGLIF